MELDQEPCGHEFETEAIDIIAYGVEKPIATIGSETLICSLPNLHQPSDIHSDGTRDWIES